MYLFWVHVGTICCQSRNNLGPKDKKANFGMWTHIIRDNKQRSDPRLSLQDAEAAATHRGCSLSQTYSSFPVKGIGRVKET